jgi:hypothetical protein
MNYGGIARGIEIQGPVDLVSQRHPTQRRDPYILLPPLRRSIRLSAAGPCSPVLGTDYLQDDDKSIGANGFLVGAKSLPCSATTSP